jgi:hypothetical protein
LMPCLAFPTMKGGGTPPPRVWDVGKGNWSSELTHCSAYSWCCLSSKHAGRVRAPVLQENPVPAGENLNSPVTEWLGYFKAAVWE